MLEWCLGAVGLAGAALARRNASMRADGARFLARFDAVPALGTYRQGRSLANFGGPKVKHAVLLVHGYSAAPSSFAGLLPALEAAGLPYYAPALSGFGLDDLGALGRVREQDWRRDVHDAYDQLAQLAEEVSVVAISFGTLLATELALEKPVKHLVLVSPYFHLKNDKEKRAHALLSTPVLGKLLMTLAPYVAKPVRPGRSAAVDLADPEAAERFFQYPVLPLTSLMVIWGFPRPRGLERLKTRSLTVLHGHLDGTSNVHPFLADLDGEGVRYAVHGLPDSAHNLFADRDGAEATRLTLAALGAG